MWLMRSGMYHLLAETAYCLLRVPQAIRERYHDNPRWHFSVRLASPGTTKERLYWSKSEMRQFSKTAS